MITLLPALLVYILTITTHNPVA